MNNITEKLEKIIDKSCILIDEPMSKHTSFKIGGNADFYLKVKSIEELQKIKKLAKQENISYQIIGNGTNILVREGGIRGFVLKIELDNYSIKEDGEDVYLTAGCGMALMLLAQIALKNNISGLEELSGVPGTIGGAVRMNAGCYGREMKDIVLSSKCMDENENIVELNFDEHKFEYRKSAFENNNFIILETTLKLKKGNYDEIKNKMQEYKISRASKQPLNMPNAGSIFKRCPDIPTAKLINDCGLKGYSIGGAEVSTMHSGFIVNKGNATSRDVLELIEYIRKEVKKKFDKEIELEVLVIGEE